MSSAEQDPRAAVKLPRIAITFCTQCKWLLRAAYFGQELLSTFGTSIGEVALIPATGGIFTVCLTHVPAAANGSGGEAQDVLLWDRKAEGGFPETKILKQRLRNHIEPDKKLGHSDTPSKLQLSSTDKGQDGQNAAATASHDQSTNVTEVKAEKAEKGCEDCA